MRFLGCKDTILGVLLSRRVVKIVLLKEKYENRLATIGAMETETEKIGFRQPYNYRYIQKLRSVWSSLLNLMLNYQCWI